MEPQLNPERLARLITDGLPYRPNRQQTLLIGALARFCDFEAPRLYSKDRVFVLNGYAGTGKTSLCAALVNALRRARISVVLMAPTGRAAKVFAAFAGCGASTIHRAIYRHALPGMSGPPALRENRASETVYIVDEASMIADSSGPDRDSLLRDLVQYVFAGHENRLILLGDTAQLPPVGSEKSAAMDIDVLRSMSLSVSRATLTEVARQASGSGILRNATRLRMAQTVSDPASLPPMSVIARGYDDVAIAYPEDLPDLLAACYREDGPEETIVITRSNLSAANYNNAIRLNVLERLELITSGDLLIAAKNNYFWTRNNRRIDFIANGELLRVVRVNGLETRYGLCFAELTLEVVDLPDSQFDAKIIVDCLTDPAPGLESAKTTRLYRSVFTDPELMPPGATDRERLNIMARSPWYNALQVKFAYAVTCHKAQGGQWKNVFVDLSYVPPETLGLDFYRWLYTAVTRTRTRLYFINPPETFVDGGGE